MSVGGILYWQMTELYADKVKVFSPAFTGWHSVIFLIVSAYTFIFIPDYQALNTESAVYALSYMLGLMVGVIACTWLLTYFVLLFSPLFGKIHEIANGEKPKFETPSMERELEQIAILYRKGKIDDRIYLKNEKRIRKIWKDK